MKRTARRYCCLIALCLAVFVTESIAKPGAKPVLAIDFSELDKLVPAELKEKNTPGTVIAIVSGDQVVYQKAFGVANVETNAEMQPEMLFRLGSTTKMFTAAALLTLAEKDKIKMNEPIGNRVKATELGLGLKDEEPQKPAPVAPATESEMKQYVGTYSHAPQTWEVSLKEGKGYVTFDGKEHALTKSGEKKFTFGAQNENEIVFVPGKSGKIEFSIYRALRREEDKVAIDYTDKIRIFIRVNRRP